MNELYNVTVSTKHGNKTISVISGDATHLSEKIDILTVSAFQNEYAPTPGTLIRALHEVGINLFKLSFMPYLDLRNICNVWLSEEVGGMINRIGCIEMRSYSVLSEESIIKSIKAYFQMLDIAATAGVKMSTIAMPLLGGGSQRISENLTLIPIISECLAFLQRNESCEKIIFVDINHDRACAFADALRKMYSIQSKNLEVKENTLPTVFISHRSVDKNIADNLCFKFESRGVRVWYAPRNVVGDYASSIVRAIDSCTHFVVIISENAIQSEHVLNEIDLAFNRTKGKPKIKPLRIDDVELTEPFRYYLSRQHWMDAIIPPVEEKLENFVNSVCNDL